MLPLLVRPISRQMACATRSTPLARYALPALVMSCRRATYATASTNKELVNITLY
jgi:hypothetical protein